MQILLLETVHEEAQSLLEAAAEPVIASALDAATVIAESSGCRAIITRGRGRIPAAVMEATPELRCVARCGVGLDNIDVEAASRRGVAVVHAPDSCTQSVAEHALALIFALSRQLAQLDRAVQEDHWAVRDRFRGLELAGKTLGIVGLGRIGRRTAELAQAVGMKVVTWSPHSRDDRFPALALDELLRLSDVVSLHLAL
ncbi:MAG: NAD(P)-dependent oxidoreductase, partial [Geminicoccaceae bacterium]